MPKYKVLLTDYAWSDLDIEQRILSEIDAELVAAPADQQDVQSLVKLAVGADAIMTTWAQTPREVIAAATHCQIVSRLGIGLDNIDVEYCTEQGIPVTNVPDYCLIEVAEHVLAQIFSLARKIAFYHHETKSGRYELQSGPTLRRIEGQTLGIIGLGNIGGLLAKKALALGLRVIAVSRSRRSGLPGVEFVEMDQLLAESDYVSLHLPLVPQTRHLIGAKQLRKMKRSSYLINSARGGLIDHQALAEAIAKGEISGAALDVQDPEPPDLTQPPFNDPRVVVSPHAAFASVESLENLRRRTARQIAVRLTGGVPENIVNPSVLADS